MAQLTDEMREWLRRPEVATMPTWDAIGAFIREFNLTGEQAGQLLKLWIVEVYGEIKV